MPRLLQLRCSAMHGDKDQYERTRTIEAFKVGICPVLIATDVAARGLDIKDVRAVINYDFPGNVEDYVHRIGRTGRAGNVGKALALVNDRTGHIIVELHALLMENGQVVPSFLDELVRRRQGGGGSRLGGGRNGGKGGMSVDYRSDAQKGTAAAAPAQAKKSLDYRNTEVAQAALEQDDWETGGSFGAPPGAEGGPDDFADEVDNSAW